MKSKSAHAPLHDSLMTGDWLLGKLNTCSRPQLVAWAVLGACLAPLVVIAAVEAVPHGAARFYGMELATARSGMAALLSAGVVVAVIALVIAVIKRSVLLVGLALTSGVAVGALALAILSGSLLLGGVALAALAANEALKIRALR